MSVRDFAAHLGVSDRMISKWEAEGSRITPRPINQEALDTSLSRSGEDIQARFADALRRSGNHDSLGELPRSTPLRQAREALGRSQQQVIVAMEACARQRGLEIAQRSSLKTMLSNWENGKRSADLTEKYRIIVREIFRATDADLGFPPLRPDPAGDLEGSVLHSPGRLSDLGQVTHGAPALTIVDDWQPEHTAILAEQIIGDDGDMDAATALRLAHEWLVTDPPQITESRSGRQIGRNLVDQIEDRIAKLRRMDDFVGGVDLHAAVAKEVEATVTLARDSAYGEATGKRLLSAIGELCQLAGWVASDAGYFHLAQRYYLGGATAARAAGDLPIAANLLSSLSYQMSNIGDPRDAATLARTAAKGAVPQATPAIQSLLWERVAWAEAKAHESDRCDRALGIAADFYGRSDPANEPEWIYWLNEAEMQVMAGRCYTELDRPLRAEPLLRNAIEGYDETHAREVSLYLTWLAEDYIQAHEIDQACETAKRALRLSRSVNSARTSQRIRVIQRKLEPHRKTRAVREFEDLLRSA